MTPAAKRKTILLGIIVPFEVVSAVFAWRDLARRSDEDVRGSKRFWRLFVVANPGNSMLYWLVGRRRPLVGDSDEAPARPDSVTSRRRRA